MRLIEAAGAVVTRRSMSHPGDDVLIVHRPRYDDWSLPKGKLEDAELAPVAAVREVDEETLVRIALHTPLDQTDYATSKGDKTISWWCGSAVPDAGERGEGPRQAQPPQVPAGDEVDRVSWVPLVEAARMLSYDDDRALLDQAADQPTTTPVLIVRHAKAVNRKDWGGGEEDRPLRPRGRRQSRMLADLLAAYGVRDLASSPWRRCTTSLLPYALRIEQQVSSHPVLTEHNGLDDPDGVADTVQQICERAVVEHRPAAICAHRPVLPHMLAALDIPDRSLATAECVVAHLTDTGEVHALEYHRPRA